MIFEKRIRRAFDYLKNMREQRRANSDEEILPLEKGDMGAMIFSALITILPIALLVLLIMAGIPWLLTR